MAWSPTIAYIELVSESQCDNRGKFVSSEAHMWEVIDVVSSEQCGWEQSQIKDDKPCIWYSTFNKTQLGSFILIWFLFNLELGLYVDRKSDWSQGIGFITSTSLAFDIQHSIWPIWPPSLSFDFCLALNYGSMSIESLIEVSVLDLPRVRA